MSFCRKANIALAVVALTAVPAWAKHSWEDTAKQCAEGQQKACRDLIEHAMGDEKNCFEVIDVLTDQAILAKVAQENKHYRCRGLAVQKLTDQVVLTKIAVEDKVVDVRFVAVNKLTDQSLLAKIAVEDKEPDFRTAAVNGLTDQSLLAKIAVEDKEPNVRIAAVNGLSDQSLLAKIAVEDKDADVRSGAERILAANKKLTAIGSPRGTVKSEREVYIWRASKENSSEASKPRWKIRGVLGAANLENFQEKDMVIRARMGAQPAPGFQIWEVASENGSDVCTLESGSALVATAGAYPLATAVALEDGSFPAGAGAFSEPMPFSPHLESGKRLWVAVFSGLSTPGRVLFHPILYPGDGLLFLGGVMTYSGELGTAAIIMKKRIQEADYDPLRGLPHYGPPIIIDRNGTIALTMRTIPSVVIGTIRFPEDRWTPAGPALEIKGGGLQFDDTGVFLMPGTEYRKETR